MESLVDYVSKVTSSRGREVESVELMMEDASTLQPTDDEEKAGEEEAWLPSRNLRTSPNHVAINRSAGAGRSCSVVRVALVVGLAVGALVGGGVGAASGIVVAIKRAPAPHQCEVRWQPMGQMGNQLFAYHAMREIALRHNVGICTSAQNFVWIIHLNEVFVGDLTTSCIDHRDYNLDYDRIYANNTVQMERNGNFYLQNGAFFPRSSVTLEFKAHVLRAARVALLAAGIRDGDAFVAAHVRQGDMLVAGASLPPVSWVAAQAPRVVLTDDPSSAYIAELRRLMPSAHVMTGNSAGIDLAVLSLASSVVHTLGTFGWWGAYLSRGGLANASFYQFPSSRETTPVERAASCRREGCGLMPSSDVNYVRYIDEITRRCAEDIAYRRS